MDPISIAAAALGAAKALHSVTTTIQKSLQVSRQIERCVGDFQKQATGCAQVLESLSEILKRPSLKTLASQNQELWATVNSTVQSCSSTVVELQEKLDLVEAPTNENILKQVWKSKKLGMMQEEFDEFLVAIRTHCVNLQLSIGIINVLFCASSPEAIIKDQGLRFEKLEKMIAAVDSRFNMLDASTTLVDDSIRTVTLNENTVLLRQNANSVMSMASTITALSDCQAARNSTPCLDQPAFDYVKLQEDPNPNAQHEVFSTTGSELGTPLANSRRMQIQDWIVQPSQIDDRSETNATAEKSQTTISEQTSLPSGPEMTEELATIYDESSDDDIGLEIVQNLSSKAEDYFEEKQFEAAETYFRRALNEAENFSTQKCSIIRIKDRQLRLAVCCLHLGWWDECERQLLSVAQESMRTADDARRIFEALHHLASLHLLKRNLDAALIHCRQALQGRRKSKSIGRSHQDYFQSVRLFAITLWAKADKIQAEAYADLLPEGQRLAASDFEQCLTGEFSPAKMSTRAKISLDTTTRTVIPDPTLNTHTLKSTFGQETEQLQPGEASAVSQAPSPRRLSDSTKDSDFGQVGILRPAQEAEQDSSLRKELKPANFDRAAQKAFKDSKERAKELGFELPDLIGSNAVLTSNEDEVRAAENKISEFAHSSKQRVDYTRSLLWATKHDQPHVANYILTRTKVDVNVRERIFLGRGKTPLSYAVENGSLGLCAKLLSLDAKLDACDSSSGTLLSRAASKNFGAICQVLLEGGDDVHCKGKVPGPLSFAAKHGNLDLCKVLLSHGAHVDEHIDRSKNKNVITPLQWAVGNNNSEISEFLAIQGASLEVKMSGTLKDCYIGGGTPLIWAAANRSGAETCRVLLEHGADVNAYSDEGFTALMLAARSDNVDVCRVICAHATSLNTRTSNRNTALNFAARRGYFRICQVLLEHGAEVNIQGEQGDTALMPAVEAGSRDTCRTLLQYEASVSIKNAGAQIAAELTTDEGIRSLLSASYENRSLSSQSRS